MEVLEQLYEGKAKKVFKTDDDSLYLIRYKDDATAFNGAKKGSITDKGIMNNAITTLLFEALGRPALHIIWCKMRRERAIGASSADCSAEDIVRNIAAGSFAKRYGIEEGTSLKKPTLEFCYKNDNLGDPMLNESHIVALGLATEEDMKFISAQALKINELLKKIFLDCGLILVDFKIEFGRNASGQNTFG